MNYNIALVERWEEERNLIRRRDGEPKGTEHMIDLALKNGLMVQIVRY